MTRKTSRRRLRLLYMNTPFGAFMVSVVLLWIFRAVAVHGKMTGNQPLKWSAMCLCTLSTLLVAVYLVVYFIDYGDRIYPPEPTRRHS